MKNKIAFISLIVLITFFTSCSNQPETQTADIVSAETVVAMFNATVAAAPTATATVIPTITVTNTAQIEATATVPTATNAPVKVLVPLYWEATWENLGRKDMEVTVNEATYERVTLSGYSYRASIPSESMKKRADEYYFMDNMKNLGWQFILGAGGKGILIEYYNENGYFLMMWSEGGDSPSITVWISDETTVVPVIPTPQ
ncbi:MAG: hypothetical protein QM730_06625 [Anaerolineales bacterium]